MLTSAATVVFVNRVNITEQALKDAQAKALADQKSANGARDDALAAKATALNDLQAAQGQISALQTSLNQANDQISKDALDLAKAHSDSAMQLADINKLTEGLKAAQDSNGKMQDMVADLRTTNDKLVKQSAGDAMAIADKTNLYEQADRELQFAKEQLQQTQEKANKQESLLKSHGIGEEEVASLPTGTGPVPSIQGVVRSKQDIGGITYVTVSVGSSDAVTKGMQFNVVDRDQGKFLGIVTIDSVDPTEATGRLTGPADTLSMVRPGNDVRTTFE
jgi:hypothetical protein